MTRAEEKALKAIEQKLITEEAKASHFKQGYIEGYEQAEKDFALTWQDIREIVQIADSLLENPDMRIAISNHGEEAYYTEVLKRYLEDRK